jgi:hypothetical protein
MRNAGLRAKPTPCGERSCWTGDTAAASLWMVIVTAVVDPFTFQLLRHTGTALGWVDFLGRSSVRCVQTGAGLAAADEA